MLAIEDAFCVNGMFEWWQAVTLQSYDVLQQGENTNCKGATFPLVTQRLKEKETAPS